MIDDRTKFTDDGLTIEVLDGSLDLTGTTDEVVKMLQEKTTYHEGKGFRNIKLDSVPRQWEEGYEIVMTGERDSTDEEKAAHAKKVADDKAQQEKWARQQYENLKARFDPR